MSFLSQENYELFQQYLETTNVTTTDKRLDNYYRIISRIENHNTRLSNNYRLGLNEMAVWLPHELEARFRHHPPSSSGNYSIIKPPKSVWPSSDPPFEINWANTDNPLHRSAVPEVKNQGMCGSCWAFTTIGSTHASIHINEGKPPPQLSVQELVDCDGEYNRGCFGGNPVLAYDYVMNNGVASWDDYPYTEGKAKCRRSDLQPRAKIDGFVVINSFDQNDLKKFVALGPVSIGICGTDFSFMFYAGGVFDKQDCCTTLNHAMLIVGYGDDEASGLPYWLLQNSWGNKWGDQGFMRILRSNEKGLGLCGLASSPTMAAGGRLLAASSNTSAEYVIYDAIVKTNSWIDEHWKIVMLIFAFTLLGSSLSVFIQALQRRSNSRARDNESSILESQQRSSQYGSLANT